MGRIKRSWHLAKQSYGVLMQDKELLILPVISGICILAVMAGFIFGTGILNTEEATAASAADDGNVKMAIVGFLFYVCAYTIGFFFQAALIAGALERMRGGDPTLGSALGAASKRFVPLLLWGIVAATVGMLLRQIQGRSELLGKIVAGLLGAAWTLSTFFVVPILVMERQSLGGSFKDSARMFKETWGETLSGNIGFGLLGLLLYLPVMLLAGFLYTVNPIAALVVGALGLCIIAIFLSALQGVFVASLYRYARDKEAPQGFAESELANVFA